MSLYVTHCPYSISRDIKDIKKVITDAIWQMISVIRKASSHNMF